jgi:D-alanyl-D-alanine carboxypeptidase
MAERARIAEENGTLRDAIVRAFAEAKSRGASTIEAEHLLLALAADPSSIAAQALGAVGLDHDRLVRALDEERRHSLTFAGVQSIDPELLKATPRDARPGWGASAREALARGSRGARASVSRERVSRASADRGSRRHVRFDEAELLVGILDADLGTVPRALSLAGIDRRRILEQLRVLSRADTSL